MERQTKKDKAIELMKQLGIYQPYIDGFKDEDKVCFFEMYAGFWVYQEPEIEKKMKEIEAEYKCVVYAITHEFTDFGELYDFLIAPNNKCDWDNLIYKQSKTEHIAFAYVWNKSDDLCSEFGSIGVKSFGGGIRRVA
jgi:Phage-related tail protein